MDDLEALLQRYEQAAAQALAVVAHLQHTTDPEARQALQGMREQALVMQAKADSWQVALTLHASTVFDSRPS